MDTDSVIERIELHFLIVNLFHIFIGSNISRVEWNRHDGAVSQRCLLATKFTKRSPYSAEYRDSFVIIYELLLTTISCWHNALCSQDLCEYMTHLQAMWR